MLYVNEFNKLFQHLLYGAIQLIIHFGSNGGNHSIIDGAQPNDETKLYHLTLLVITEFIQ